MADDTVVLARYTPKSDAVNGNPDAIHSTTNGFHPSQSTSGKSKSPESDDRETTANGGGVVEQMDEEEEVGDCGWGPLTFGWCQRFRDARWFLVVITLCAATQGMAINGFVNTCISTLERRFEITSTESGLIASCYDIMFVLLVIPVSYFGGHGNKPTYLGVGILILGIGSFVFSLPHFITDQYRVEDAQDTTCMRDEATGSGNSSQCSTNLPTGLSDYKYFFFLGQLLHGAGATALYTLGVTYVDENVPQRSSALYNGIFYTGAVIGPAVGFILGSELLKIYTEPGIDAASLGLDENNPKWVGAWWIGFLISGCMGCLLSLPLLAFPRALPGHKKFAAERGLEVHNQGRQDNTGKTRGVKDILMSIKLLLCNWPFMFINLAAAADGILVGGFSTFMPKFIEYQFGYPAGTAALYVGLAVVPTGGGATLLSGYIVRRFNMKVKSILKLCTALSVALCPLVLAFLMECKNTPYAGVTVNYGQTDFSKTDFIGKQLDNECNADCGCAEQDYFPMCGRDNVLYFSPCYAGCTTVRLDGDVKTYSNCSCVSYNLTAEDFASGETHMGEFGKCSYSCGWVSLFMPLFGVMIVLVFGVSMPSLTATLRCIPDHQRSFGLGLQWIVARCLGSIPGPILFGRMFDLACLVWQTRCDGTGSCFFYDNQKMSILLLTLAVIFCFLAALTFGLALYFYKVKEDDESEEVSMEIRPDNSVSPLAVANDNNVVPPEDRTLEEGEVDARGDQTLYYDNQGLEDS